MPVVDAEVYGEVESNAPSHTIQRFYCTEFPPCTLSFTRSEHLARHIRKHTGERPFHCHCGRRFSRLDNLRQHAQNVHAEEEIPSEAKPLFRQRVRVRSSRLVERGPAPKRSSSIASTASSRNSSLGGGDGFDRDYQRPDFLKGRAESGSDYAIEPDSPNFPPVPLRRPSHTKVSQSNTNEVDRPVLKERTVYRNYYSDSAGNASNLPNLPNIHCVTPLRGPVAGGTKVTIEGSDFYEGLTVHFGNNETPVIYRSDQYLECVVPPSLYAGGVLVRLRDGHDLMGASFSAVYFYTNEGVSHNMELYVDQLLRHDRESPKENGGASEPQQGICRDASEEPNSSQAQAKVGPAASEIEVDNSLPLSQTLLPSSEVEEVGIPLPPSQSSLFNDDSVPQSYYGEEIEGQGGVQKDDADDILSCYICNRDVDVKSKRVWQKHVLEDLEPYQCVEKHCRESDQTFSSIKQLRHHYGQQHHDSSMLATTGCCPFCSEPFPERDFNHRLKHICRHMQDIAFATVPRVQVDWQFYSELGSDSSP